MHRRQTRTFYGAEPALLKEVTVTLYLSLIAAIALIVVLLRKKIPIGIAILLSGLLIWVVNDRTVSHLGTAVINAFELPRNWDLLFALYFVMCLEIQLRESGTLKGMVEGLNGFFSSTKVILSAMPAFLGLLPSLGGARFSCPIVEEASRDLTISPESKASINFWFRHIFEFSSPIVPGLLLGCSIAHIQIGDFIAHLAWVTVLSFVAGWVVMIRTLHFTDKPRDHELSPDERKTGLFNIALAIAPIVFNVVLMLIFGLSAALSMGLVTLCLFPVLWAVGRPVSIPHTLKKAFDVKLLGNVACILTFIQLLSVSGVLNAITQSFEHSTLPVPIIIALISLMIGTLTGMSQAHVAMVMPLVAQLAPGSLELAGIAMIFGVAGQMWTPTHVCLTISIDYFKADFLRTLKPIMLAEGILLLVFSLWTYFTWS